MITSFTRRLSLELLERREVLSVTFVDSGQVFGGPEEPSLAVSGMKAADMDGDGDQDVVARPYHIYEDGTIWWDGRVWLNDGNGGFTASGQILPNAPRFALGDVNGDQHVDVLAIAATHEPGALLNAWINDGSGSFSLDHQTPIDGNLFADIRLADFDGDGDLDAFLLGSLTYSRLPISVWLNDGQGGFLRTGQTFEGEEGGGGALATGDLDGDGDVDVFVGRGSRSEGNEESEVWLNNGRGHFAKTEHGIPTVTAHEVALVDLDGDVDLDVYVKSSREHDQILLNDGSGNFSVSGQAFQDEAKRHVSGSLGDLDGDGDVDAIAVNCRGLAANCEAALWHNDGTGQFGQPIVLAKTEEHGEIREALFVDIDGDQDLDVILTNDLHQARIWENITDEYLPGDGDLDFEFNQLDIVQVLASAKYLTGEPATWEEGDWNGDGVFDQKDIVAALATGNYLQGPYADTASTESTE